MIDSTGFRYPPLTAKHTPSKTAVDDTALTGVSPSSGVTEQFVRG